MYALQLEKKVKAFQQMDNGFEHVFRGDFAVADGIVKEIEFTDDLDPTKDAVYLYLKIMIEQKKTFPLVCNPFFLFPSMKII